MYLFRCCKLITPCDFANLSWHQSFDCVGGYDKDRNKKNKYEVRSTVQVEDMFWNLKVKGKHKEKEQNQQGTMQSGGVGCFS